MATKKTDETKEEAKKEPSVHAIENQVIITGFLGKDPVTEVFGKTKVTKFSLATNAMKKGVKATDWHNIVCFNKVSEEAEKSFKKGTKATVVGRISYNVYTDKNGVKRTYTDIIATELILR